MCLGQDSEVENGFTCVMDGTQRRCFLSSGIHWRSLVFADIEQVKVCRSTQSNKIRGLSYFAGTGGTRCVCLRGTLCRSLTRDILLND